jgi:hypothetical protein
MTFPRLVATQLVAGRRTSKGSIDADWQPNLLSVELLFEAHHASRFEISPE